MRDALTVAGLIYDIVGVSILALALVLPRARALYHHAGTYYGGNKALFKVLKLQKIDALFGLPILLVGFGLQLLGALRIEGPKQQCFVYTPLIVAAVVYFATRFWIGSRSDALFDRLAAQERGDNGAD